MAIKKIPLMDLAREYPQLKKDIARHMAEVVKTHHWILGEKVSEFEAASARYVGARYAVGVANGTDALLLSLRALSIERTGKEFFSRKQEIITTPFTFVATAETIMRAGATPVFVDINPETYALDPRAVADAITPNTVGIMPVHLYGLSADMNQLIDIAREHKLWIVEDNAQSFGAAYYGRKTGILADMGAHSFFPSKTLGCWGDGGLVTTNNERLAELVKILRHHGQIESYNAVHVGYNSRLDSLQAAVLCAKLKHIDAFNDARRKAAALYNRGLAGIDGVELPVEPVGCRHVYGLYTIKVPVDARQEFLKYLNVQGIEARAYYPKALHQMEVFKEARVSGAMIHVDAAAAQVVTLPLHSCIRRTEINRVIAVIRKFFGLSQ